VYIQRCRASQIRIGFGSMSCDEFWADDLEFILAKTKIIENVIYIK
jgi:hypothetical protein